MQTVPSASGIADHEKAATGRSGGRAMLRVAPVVDFVAPPVLSTFLIQAVTPSLMGCPLARSATVPV